MFVTARGSPYARLQRALDARHLLKALDAAAELRVVSLDDAMELCLLLAEAGDRRYETAARRWLQRFANERGPTLGQILLAGAALSELGSQPRSAAARETLERLLGAEA